MERIKLFGTPEKRRKLFSDPRRKLFSTTSRVVVCQDCGTEVVISGTTTDGVCPECGGRRFLLKDVIPAVPEEDVLKTFSKRRRSLFSEAPEAFHYECRDCGHSFESPLKGKLRCPNCGGDRVVCNEESEDGLHEDFSETYDATDEFLKEFSGKSLPEEKLTRIFSERGINETPEGMIDAGYAHRGNNGEVCFSERPDIQRKLFSKLVISVTKELELVPVSSKEALIHKLLESGNLPEKSITLIGKAHGVDPCGCSCGNYIEDSGLLKDLQGRRGEVELPVFQGLLKEQYNDAPDDIMNKLVSSKIIDISGNRVIIK